MNVTIIDVDTGDGFDQRYIENKHTQRMISPA